MNRNIETLVIGTDTFDNVAVMSIRYYQNAGGLKELSCSFDIIEPLRQTPYDIECLINDRIAFMDSDTKLNLIEEFDCKPSELAETLVDDYDIYEDADVYKDMPILEDKTLPHKYFFQCCSCGQSDPRKLQGFKPICDSINTLLTFWDKYHLKATPQRVFEEIDAILGAIPARYKYENFDTWAKSYLASHFNVNTDTLV